MPNLTTPYLNLGGRDIDKDMDDVQDWSIALIEELRYILCNLDAGNCMEAGKVQAKNIDCSKARIHNAQIQSLTADKLTAGTIDAEEIDVINMKAGNIATGTLDVSDRVTIQGESDDARMVMNAQTLIFYEKDKNGNEIPRIYMGYDKDKGKYVFEVYNNDYKKEVYLDDDGNAFFSGTIKGGKIEADTDINVTTDATIGNHLKFRDPNVVIDGNDIGAEIYIENQNSTFHIKTNNSRSIWLETAGNVNVSAGNYIAMTCKDKDNRPDLTVNDKRILVKDDYDELSKEISALKLEIQALKNASNT